MTTLTLDQYYRLQDLVKALESGKYKQGKHQLRIRDCYCVMGVACDVYDSSKWFLVDNTDIYFYGIDPSKTNYPYHCNPPGSIEYYYGLSSSTVDYIMNLNDNYNYTFKEIAEWIKDNLLKPASEIYKD